MIVKEDFLSKLRRYFVLNLYEVKIWTALLSRGVATAGELSDIANVPRSRSYDVLESLERKGFVIMKLGKPIKYIAVPPQEVLERVKKSIREDAERQANLIDGLKKTDVLGELSSLYTQGIRLVEPVDLTGVVKSRQNLYSHLGAAIKNAQKSVLVMTSEQGLARKADELKSALQKAKDKGVSIKILAAGKQSQAAKSLQGIAQVKHAENVPARFAVIDGKQVITMVPDDATVHPNYDFGIWVSAENYAKGFESVFKLLWDKS
jgi:sugar-specific transcriptional regulator TrmB